MTTMKKELRNLKLFTGNANPELAQEIAEYLGVKLGAAKVQHFSDGEISLIIDESVRGSDAYIIQPTCTPVNDNLMELLIMIDALRRASAKRITAVLPYYGYARQDRKSRGREPITAKLVANLITKAGARRVLAMDLHAQQIQGFFDIPVDNLFGLPILAEYYKHKETENLVVVSPDMGGVARARNLAAQIGVPLAIIDKRRPRPVSYTHLDVYKRQGYAILGSNAFVSASFFLMETDNLLLKFGSVVFWHNKYLFSNYS